MSDAYVSGKCAYPGCNRQCTNGAYCAQHFKIVNEQKNRETLETIASLLGQLNTRFDSLERTIKDNIKTQPIEKNINKPIDGPVKNKPKLKTKQEESQIFIPTVGDDLPDVQINSRRSHITTRNIDELAKKLKTTK